VLDGRVTPVGLQRPRVVAPIGQARTHKRGLSIWGCVLNDSFAAFPARSIMRAKPAVVNGAPRSELNTNGDLGSCSRWSRRTVRWAASTSIAKHVGRRRKRS
jgi:hypothetical protein